MSKNVYYFFLGVLVKDRITGWLTRQLQQHQVDGSKEASEHSDDAANPQWYFSIRVVERGRVHELGILEQLASLFVKLIS